MKTEVLLATMFFESEDKDYLSKVNVQTDLIVANQCDENKDYAFTYDGHNVKVLCRSTRGVGKNRNLALANSTADVVLFADNDVCYYDDYSEKIEKFYFNHSDADVVIFNFKESRDNKPFCDINVLTKKARLKEATKFGTFAVSARRERLIEKDVKFSLLFGGGAKYGSGEDSVFISECFKKKLNVYLCADTLGEVIHRESTWFNGISEKYVFDKGALFRAMCPKIFRLAIIRHIIKYRRLYASVGNPFKVYGIMLKGAKDYVRTVNGKDKPN